MTAGPSLKPVAAAFDDGPAPGDGPLRPRRALERTPPGVLDFAPSPGAGLDRKRWARRRPPAGLLIPALLAAALSVLPLCHVLWQTFQVSREEAAALLMRPLIGLLLVNTIGLVLSATACCAVLGTGVAWFVERTEFPGRKAFGSLMPLPLAIPSFVTSYAWVSMSQAFEGYWGALLVVTLSYTPLVYLPVAAALRGMDPALEEVARSLGADAAGRFVRVILPQLRPALLGGMLLVALNVLVEFGAFTLLHFRTFTTEIFVEYRVGFNGPQASLLSLVLIGLCLLCLCLEYKVRGRSRYARVDRGTRKLLRPIDLGLARIAVTGAFSFYIAVTIAVPFAMIGFWLTRHNSAAISPVIATPGLVLLATIASLQFAAYGVVLTLALAAPVAFLATRYTGRLVTLLERATYLAQGVPGIVVALAMIALTVRSIRPLYQSTLLLEIAYAILFMPLAVVSLRATFAQMQPALEDAARSLGLSRLAVAWRIMLPLAAPGIGAAAAIVFMSISTELTATLLLAPPGTETLATEIWSDTTSMAFAASAPYAALTAAASLISTWVLANRFGRVGSHAPAAGL